MSQRSDKMPRLLNDHTLYMYHRLNNYFINKTPFVRYHYGCDVCASVIFTSYDPFKTEQFVLN